MLAPIDFIKEKYIKPNNITQDFLCDSLNLGKKTISELYQHKRGFTIHTAKKFAKFFGLKPEFIMMKQVEYDLAHDTKSYDDIVAYHELSKNQKQESISKWILSTINNSISDKSAHYTGHDLLTILEKTDTSKPYHYAIVSLFKEVAYDDLLEYCKSFHIDKKNLKKIYTFYKTEFNAKEIESYEWLFEEL
jgi:plasmid maintenance system antidote protein VapI